MGLCAIGPEGRPRLAGPEGPEKVTEAKYGPLEEPAHSVSPSMRQHPHGTARAYDPCALEHR